MVDTGEDVEDVVVIDRHDADDQEADQVSEVAGPELDECPRETVFPFDLFDRGDANLENQERDRNREHPVAECFEAGGVSMPDLPMRCATLPEHDGLSRDAMCCSTLCVW